MLNIMDTDPIVFTEISDFGRRINALGYNPIDNLLYSNSFETGELLRYSANGEIENLGLLSNGDKWTSNGGTFDVDGIFYYIRARGPSAAEIWSLNITSLVAAKVMDITPSPLDLALNPADGLMYGVVGDRLFRYDLDNAQETDLGQISGIQAGGDIGAAWFTLSGDLLIYGALDGLSTSQNDIARIDVTTLDGIIISANGETAAGNDGASCPFGILMEKSVSKDTVAVGETFNYIIEVFNETGGTVNNITFEDILDPRFEFVSIVTNEFDPGIVTLPNEIRLNNFSLPLGLSTLEFSVRVKSPGFCVDQLVGNLASLDGLSPNFGTTIFSDDHTTALQNDSTYVVISASGGSSSAGIISPASISECGSVSENISISGHNGTVEWQVSTDNNIWNLFTGVVVDASTITIEHTNTTTSTQTFYYRARVFDGLCGEAFTSPIRVDITAGLSVNPTTSPLTYCQNETGIPALTATPSVGGVLNWYTDNIITTALASAPIPTTTTVGTPSQTYYVSQTIGGCESNRVAINVNIIELPTSDPGDNITLCEGETINLDGTGSSTGLGITYEWTGPNSYSSTSQSPVITNATLSMAGTYTLTVTRDLCSVDSTVEVIINETPSVPIVGSNSPVCLGEDLNLTAEGEVGATYSWTGPNSYTSTDEDPTITGTTSNMTGTYNVTQTLGGCTSPSANISVTINPIPIITTISNTICSESTFNINPIDGTNGVVPSGTTYSWGTPTGIGFTGGTSSTGESTISGTLTNTNTLPVTATYSVTPTTGTCSGTPFNVSITLNPSTQITTEPAGVNTCADSDVNFSVIATGTNLSYQWQKDGIDLPLETNAILNLTNVKTSDEADYSCLLYTSPSPRD